VHFDQLKECPFIERHDARCADSLTLQNLSSAFALCVGRHETCPRFHQIRAEDAVRRRTLLVPAVA
jgi:hypothetical protein